MAHPATCAAQKNFCRNTKLATALPYARSIGPSPIVELCERSSEPRLNETGLASSTQ